MGEHFRVVIIISKHALTIHVVQTETIDILSPYTPKVHEIVEKYYNQ